jgi:hypothetical protein
MGCEFRGKKFGFIKMRIHPFAEELRQPYLPGILDGVAR